MNLDDIINELLSTDVSPVRQEARQSVFSMFRRKDIDKALLDQIQVEKQNIASLGARAAEFLNSVYYRDLIEPMLRDTVKSGLQKLIRECATLTENEMRCELANIKKCIEMIAYIKLKIVQGQNVGGDTK